MGDESFYRALRYFLTSERHKMVGWQEIRKAFEKESGKSLTSYFTQWVREKGLPEISSKTLMCDSGRINGRCSAPSCRKANHTSLTFRSRCTGRAGGQQAGFIWTRSGKRSDAR